MLLLQQVRWLTAHLLVLRLVWGMSLVMFKARTQVFFWGNFAGLLALDGVGNLKGWQWLFIMEGLPTVLMGIYTFCCLAEMPATVIAFSSFFFCDISTVGLASPHPNLYFSHESI